MKGKDTLLYACVITASLIKGVDLCGTSQFQCGNGQCIDMSLKCNNDFDCQDASDEEKCTASNMCPEGLFRCPSGTCIDLSNENCTDTTTQQTTVDFTSSSSQQSLSTPEDMSTTDVLSGAKTVPITIRTTQFDGNKAFTTKEKSTYEQTSSTTMQITTFKQLKITTMQPSTLKQTYVPTLQKSTYERTKVPTKQKSTYKTSKGTTMHTSTYRQTHVPTMPALTYGKTGVTKLQTSTIGGNIPHENNTKTGIIVIAVLVPVIILVSVALFVRYKRKSQGNIV